MTSSELSRNYDVVIAGAGPAGISAAARLADSGLSILVLDENARTGGQILRRYPGAGVSHADPVKRMIFSRMQRLESPNIRILHPAHVTGIFPGREMLVESLGTLHEVRAKALIIAAGARERFLPFRGWTLPGVISTGAAQILVKGSGILPAQEMVIAGAGLFLPAVAHDFIQNGGRLQALVTRNRLPEIIPPPLALAGQQTKMHEGAQFLWTLVRNRTPVKFGAKVIEACGKKMLEEIVFAATDRKGEILPGTEQVIRTGMLVVGHGFVPNVELVRSAGCTVVWSPDGGGWAADTGDDLETDVENIFAAGEVTGVGGALKSLCEGEIAALSVLHKLEKISESRYADESGQLKKERRKHLRFARYFNRLCRITPEDVQAIPDETIICRCEALSMGDIRKAVNGGAATPGAVKKALRAGMGRCQGSTCGPMLYDIIAACSGKSPGEMLPLSTRYPVRPVALGSLAGCETACVQKAKGV